MLNLDNEFWGLGRNYQCEEKVMVRARNRADHRD